MLIAGWPKLAPESTTFSTVFSAPSAWVFGDEPGCVYPSMTTGLEIVGSTDAVVIVQTPEPSQPAPDTLNAIVSSAGRGVGGGDRLAQRAGARVVGVCHGEGGAAAAIEAENPGAKPRGGA